MSCSDPAKKGGTPPRTRSDLGRGHPDQVILALSPLWLGLVWWGAGGGECGIRYPFPWLGLVQAGVGVNLTS